MKLSISKDGPNCGDVSIQKLFQFSIIGKKNSDSTHQIDMFNAICFKAEKNTESLKLICDIHFKNFTSSQSSTNRIQTKFTDKMKYFEELDILKQFWGEDAFSSNNSEDFILKIKNEFNIKNEDQDKLSEEVSLIYSVLDSVGSIPLFIKNSEDTFIILPFKAYGQTPNKITLKSKGDLSSLKILKDKISLGFWFHNVADMKLKNLINSDNVNSEIEFRNQIKSPDFKIYFQVDETVELKRNKVVLDYKLESSTDAEIIQVYSQSGIKYFQDWITLGIYKSTLLRLHNNKSVNDRISNGFSTIKTELELEDIEATYKKGANLFILSIFISALMAMGLDSTRLISPDFLVNFPKIPIFSEAFIWFLICLGVIPKYLVLKNTFLIKAMYKVIIKLFCSFFFIWIFCCFFIKEGILTWMDIPMGIELSFIKLTNWTQLIPIIDLILSIYLMSSVYFIASYKKYKTGKILTTFKFIFGVE